MKEIVWKEDYNLNIPSIDTQHRKLFVYLNNLRNSILNHEQETVIKETLSDLINYGFEHFSYEENLLKEINYPDFSDHQKRHDYYNGNLIRLQNKFVHGDAVMATDLILFIKKWLIDHILVEDKKYQIFCLENKINLEP